MPCPTSFLALIIAIAQAPTRQTAIIVDVGGIETKLTDFTTDNTEFGGLDMGSAGIPIVMKQFLVGPRTGGGAAYRRWAYLDDVEHIEIKQGFPTGVALRLRTGVTVSGSFGSVNPEFVVFRGQSEFGDFSLPSDKVRSITLTAPLERRHPDVLGTGGASATITLRDGTVLIAQGVQRHCFFPSRYINVRGHSEHYASIWLRYMRGEAGVETELPFRRLKEIAFDAPVVTATGHSSGSRCKVTLRDGTTLSGDCQGSGTEREFRSLIGRTDGVIFEVVRDLGYAIKTIQFSE